MDESYRTIGQRWSLLSSERSQTPISGSLAFIGDDPYAQYYEFVRDVSPKGLKFTYTTDDGRSVYKKDVRIKSLEKTELTEAGFLDCSVEFTPSTPWYRELTLVTTPARITDNDGWVWEEHTEWPNRFRSTADMSIVIDVDTDTESPCALIIDGPITNPTWSHYVNGVLFETGKINCTVLSGNHLVIDNRRDPYRIAIFNSDLTSMVQDVYQLSDFTTKRFIKLQNGQNSIQVSADSATTVEIRMEANLYYDSV